MTNHRQLTRYVGAICALIPLLAVGDIGKPPSTAEAAGLGYVSLAASARILDTRADGLTADGQFAGGGVRTFGSTLQLVVAGRAGVPSDAASVVLNVTVTEAQGAGVITVFPCEAGRPTASNLNYVANTNVPNLVISKIGAGGVVCLFNSAATQLIVDVAGYFPGVDAFTALPAPARLLDTRLGTTTIDGGFAGGGLRPSGAVVTLQVTGRAGVPGGVPSVVLNVTVDQPQIAGFVTVYPCGGGIPTASNLNYTAGQTVPNAVISRLSAAGTVCLFNSGATHLIVDIAGYFADQTVLVPLAAPARLLDTRAGGATFDGSFSGTGLRPSTGTIQLNVAGRAGIPGDASAVVLNVTVDQPQANGFITVYPSGVGRPNASNLNYLVGQTVPNAVIARLASDGSLCLYSLGAAHLVVDVAGYFTGPAPVGSGTCPPDPVVPTAPVPPTVPPAPPPAPIPPSPVPPPVSSSVSLYVSSCLFDTTCSRSESGTAALSSANLFLSSCLFDGTCSRSISGSIGSSSVNLFVSSCLFDTTCGRSISGSIGSSSVNLFVSSCLFDTRCSRSITGSGPATSAALVLALFPNGIFQ